jgi:thymidylate synthase (FAD)
MDVEQITVEYLDHMGTDLTVVNAARTSFGKESDWVYAYPPEDAEGNQLDHEPPKVLKPEDANLIRYLATGYRTKEWDEFLGEILEVANKHIDSIARTRLTKLLHAYKRRPQHWAPFAHPHLSLRMQLPMFLARQFVKHQIGGTWSEESRRYISDEPGVWFPNEWHGRPEDVKQGSGYVIGTQVFQDDLSDRAEKVAVHALNTYEEMVAAGVAPEEARIVLPLNTMTTVTWTGSLLFWSRVCNQRVDSHAQLAAQELGRQIADIVRPHYPVSWAALCGE